VRNAFLLLFIVALIIVGLGAANSSIAFDFDVVFATWTAVSLIWVAVVLAAILLVVGLVAAWFAQSEASRTRRKVEAELQATYVRLRAAEARLPEEPHEASEAPEPSSSVAQNEVVPSVAGEGEVPHAG
jgi:uncharacterized membrane protein YciS (DUF1049 family)